MVKLFNMNISRISIVLVILLLSVGNGIAQVYSGVNNNDISRELRKRGISEAELREKTTAAGMNIDSVAFFTPLQLSVLESIIIDLEENKSEISQDTVQNRGDADNLLLDPELVDIDSLDTTDSLLVAEDDSILPEPIRYGQSIFRDRIIKEYTDLSGVKAPANYLLGPGDELVVSLWGRSSVDEKYVIASDGSVKIFNGNIKVFLKGLTLDQARQKLISNYKQNYNFNDGQFDLSLSYSRTVQVNVYGEVYSPGPVTLSAINSAFVALAAADGPTNIGSLRKIQLIRSNGKRELLDVYEYLNNPNPNNSLYLQDGDVILVPPAEHIVTLAGAVRRPYEYEVTTTETLEDVIIYGGGFNGNADKRYLTLQRFTDDLLKIYDVDYQSGEASRFLLENGDSITVNTLDSILVDFVEVSGAVKQEGKYQLDSRMRISDLIEKSKLKEEARKDIAFLKRINADSTVSYIEIDIDKIISDSDSQENIYLRSKDNLTIWYLKAFSDSSEVAVSGAVREEGSFPYDISNNVKLREAILFSGGLRRDASELAIIHRRDPLNKKEIEYVTITNLSQIMDTDDQSINITLNPFDSIHIYSDTDFIEDAQVTIEGAVSSPGPYLYGKNMGLKDLFVLAGGIKMNGAKNRIEISRVVIKDNEPTRIAIANLTIDEKYNVIEGGEKNYKLSPFDVVTVRYVPDFELQKRVSIEGEIIFPGRYTILSDNERLSDLIERSGGLTGEAFPSGATLIRTEDNLGAVVIKLDEVLNNKSSEFNFILKDGDIVNIPKQKEFVTIEGATKAETVLSDDAVNLNNRIHVPFTSKKRALYYINSYAGGLSNKADRNGIFVEYPNGEVKRSSSILGITKTPKVRKGSTIKVREKSAEKDEEDAKEDVNWGEVLSDTVAQAVSILTLVLLVQGLE